MSAANFRLVASASTNLTQIAQPNENFAGIYLLNTSSSTIYVKLYVGATQPVVGTTVPWMTFQVAANVDRFINPTESICANAAIWLATTANAADSDSTPIS